MALQAVKLQRIEDILTYLPSDQKEVITSPGKAGLLLIALGVILAIGGIFLTLAAHQILPQGANAISNLGVGGQILSYGFIGLGALASVSGIIKYLFYSTVISDTALDKYMEDRVGVSEILAIDIPDKKEVRVFYRRWTGSEYCFIPDTVPYEQDPEQALQDWGSTHSLKLLQRQFIEGRTLRSRIDGTGLLPVIPELV